LLVLSMFGASNQAGHNRNRLQSYHLIRHVAGQGLVKVREAADWHTGNQLVRNAAIVATLITTHQEDVLPAGDFGQSLSKRIPLLESVAVVLEEKHADHLGPVPVLLELGKDHLAKLVRDGMALRREDVRDLQ